MRSIILQSKKDFQLIIKIEIHSIIKKKILDWQRNLKMVQMLYIIQAAQANLEASIIVKGVEIEAAKAYNRAAKVYRGEFAILNIIKENES